MAVSEQRRHQLHEWMRASANEEVAATVMELLPPAGWADVATKRDLDHLQTGVRLELSEGLRGIDDRLRVQLVWMVGSIWTALGVALAALGR